MLAHRSFGALAALAIGTASLAAAPAPHVAPGFSAFSYDAVVSKFGVLKRQSGATTAVLSGTGRYTVDFPADVSGCTFVASLGRATEAGGAAEKPGYVSVAGAEGDSHGVFVETRDMRGRLRDYAFHLLVGC